MFKKPFRAASALALAFLLMLASGGASGRADAPFLEPDVQVVKTFDGETIGDGFGWLAENLGDISGDGINDFGITAPFRSENGTVSGKVYIYSGATRNPLTTITGEPGERLGYSLNAAGDVDGDGRLDYVTGGIGSPGVPGRVSVYSGRTHEPILHLHKGGEFFGFEVAGAGDVNADGKGDILVSAPIASYSYPAAGRVYMFSGKDGSVLWTIDGEQEGAHLGIGAGVAGFLDRDDVPDFVAAAEGAGKNRHGQAYVLSGVDGSTLVTMDAFASGTTEVFGRYFASGAGDINADGTPDIFIGDYANKSGGGEGTGRAYIYSGLDGSLIHVFSAEHKEDGFGIGRGAGDVDVDGYDDLIIAAYTNEDGGRAAGKAYVYSGRDGALLRTMTDTIPFDFFGVDAIAVGDVTGDGKIDFLVTGVNFAETGLDHSYLIEGQ